MPETDVPPEETPLEAPDTAAAEQLQQLREEERDWPEDIPLEVGPADAAEQERTVDLDEDDYR